MANDIASRVERYRALKGLTQKELAEQAGLSRGGFTKMLEKNKFTSDALESIAQVLGVSIINLVSDIDVNKETLRKLGEDLNNLADSL